MNTIMWRLLNLHGIDILFSCNKSIVASIWKIIDRRRNCGASSLKKALVFERNVVVA